MSNNVNFGGSAVKQLYISSFERASNKYSSILLSREKSPIAVNVMSGPCQVPAA